MRAGRGILWGMYTHILFATDGSSFSDDALRDAIGLAKLSGGRLRVVTIVESPSFHGTPEAMVLYETEMYRTLAAELERIGRGAIERAVRSAVDAGVAATGAVRHGLPAEEILAEAREWGADCIVLATHGRTGLGRLLLGSVASRVLHDADVPVLLHRTREKKS